MHQLIKALTFKLNRLARGFKIYKGVRKTEISSSKGVIYFSLKSNPYLRFLYVLVKFFRMEGYDVAFRTNFLFLADLETSKGKDILNEDLAYFVKQAPQEKSFTISDQNSETQLSANYFKGLLDKEIRSNSYYVPMCMHPSMYHNGLWNESVSIKGARLKSIFFAGSLDREGYSRISKHSYFQVLNRVEIIDSLRDGPIFFPNNIEELEARTIAQEIVVIDTAKFRIPINSLRETIKRYAFFLACPGVVMPFSHNLVEAMSVGSIPIVERGYAELFVPHLQHLKNAIVFDGVEDLQANIETAFSLKSNDIAQIHQNVLQYYQTYLTPTQVVKTILEQQPRSIFLIAEHNSLELLP